MPAEKIEILALPISNTLAAKYGSWQVIRRQKILGPIVIYRILYINSISATRFLHILTFYRRFPLPVGTFVQKCWYRELTHHYIKVKFTYFSSISMCLGIFSKSRFLIILMGSHPNYSKLSTLYCNIIKSPHRLHNLKFLLSLATI